MTSFPEEFTTQRPGRPSICVVNSSADDVIHVTYIKPVTYIKTMVICYNLVSLMMTLL